MRGEPRVLRAVLWIACLLVSSGCSAKLGIYRAPSFDAYRPRAQGERAVIRTELARPIQWLDNERIQGIPITVELSAERGVRWGDLDGAFTIHETRRFGGGRVQRTSRPAFLLPYVRGTTAQLSNYPELDSGDVAAARRVSSAILDSLSRAQEARLAAAPGGDDVGSDNERRITFFLICAQSDSDTPCVQFGRRYDIEIQPPVRLRGTPGFSSALYPFRMERRSLPVTIGAGVLLSVVFLAVAGS